MNERTAYLKRFAEAIRINSPTNDQCIVMSLALRDTFNALGFTADVRSVGLVMSAFYGPTQLHSLGVGVRRMLGTATDPKEKGWDGHLVVIAEGLLIDPMLPAYRRNAWESCIPDHLVPVPVLKECFIRGYPAIATRTVVRGDFRYECDWLAVDNDEWTRAPAADPAERTEYVMEWIARSQAAGVCAPQPKERKRG